MTQQSKSKAPSVGKKYSAVRRNGARVVGKLASIETGKNGPWARLSYTPEGAKRGTTASFAVRPSQLQAA